MLLLMAVILIVDANPLYESYTIEGLQGNISVVSTSQVYVATFGAYDYATFGGYYSGFEFKPEIILETLDNEDNLCIPNLTLSLSSISTYDQYQWYFNDEVIEGANNNNFTPTEPGYYQYLVLLMDAKEHYYLTIYLLVLVLKTMIMTESMIILILIMTMMVY